MSHDTPTVVLVHGAFADGSSWNGVIERLQDRGVHVIARRIRYVESRSTPRTPLACSSGRLDPFSRSATLTAAP
jgi:hypothetical protein